MAENEIKDEEEYIFVDTENFKLRRISALILVIIAGMYLAFGDHNKTLELIMLGLASFLIGASILQFNPKK